MMKNNYIKYGLIGFMTLLVIYLGVYTINTGNTGVLATWGKYQEKSVEPGLHFKLPFAQTINVLDTKMQSANYSGNVDEPDGKGVINKPKIAVLDSKNLPIGIELTIMYTPDSTNAAAILGEYGTNYFEKLINPRVRDVIRNVVGNYQAEKIANERNVISTEIATRIVEKFKSIPFTLNEISLRNISLPRIVLQKVEEVQLAKQEEQKLAMIENQAKKKQSIQTIQANTLLIEITTKAKADAEKQKIAADAQAYQVKVEAIAVAEANIVISKSITPQLIRYKAIEQWNGLYPKMLLTGGDSSNIIQLPKMD